jgi:hypothetical protein
MRNGASACTRLGHVYSRHLVYFNRLLRLTDGSKVFDVGADDRQSSDLLYDVAVSSGGCRKTAVSG